MADNVVLNAGAGGVTLATDDVGGVHYQIVKPAYGPLDTATLVTASVGLPVAVVGTVPVSGPATDAQLRATALPVSLATAPTTPVTVANGADVAEGNTADAAWVSGAGTVISLLKKIASAGGSAVSIADGADVAEGTTTDTAWTSGAGTVISLLKKLVAQLAGSLAVTGTFWQATQPVSGTVTANAGAGTLAVSAASLPLPAGASTAAKQPALGTAGAASADVISVQGIASMTKLLVTPDSVALPANQSVNVAQINGVTPLMGNGATGTGSPRVTIADNQTAFTVKANLEPETAGGLSTTKLISAATTNATSLKASAGQVYGIQVFNLNAAARYLRFYNKASAPTVGTDATAKLILIPGNTAGAGVVADFPNGVAFGTGIAYALTTGIADTDTGAVAAAEIVVNIDYK